MPKFDAFISYSRTDTDIARQFESKLQRYRLPAAFRDGAGDKPFRIFRDEHDIELGDYAEVIAEAMRESEHLIVFCSPTSARSNYVNDEIRTYAKIHGRDGIIPILVSGRPNSEVKPDDVLQDWAFPPALTELFGEPIAADVRRLPRQSWWRHRARVREAFFQVVARLLDIEKTDALVARDRWRHRAIAAGVFALVSATATAGGWIYYDSLPKPGAHADWASVDPDARSEAKADFSRLRHYLAKAIPQKRAGSQLLVATWNLRAFGAAEPGSARSRSPQALNVMAETISRFDLVAVQELQGDEAQFTAAMDELLRRLGRHWRYVGSGVAGGRRGNGERLGFLYDTRSVAQSGQVDEVVLSSDFLERVAIDEQIARTPFVAAFRHDMGVLTLANAHILFGRPSGPALQQRYNEFDALSLYLVREARAGRLPSDRFLLLGDLNFSRPESPMVEIAEANGIYLDPDLTAAPSNIQGTRPYDQILFGWDPSTAPCLARWGVADLFSQVYREEDFERFRPAFRTLEEKRLAERGRFDAERFYRTQWRTFQISDHVPKWVALDFDC